MPDKQKKDSTSAAPAHTATAGQQPRQLPVILGPVIIVLVLAVFWLPQLLSNAAATVNGEAISASALDRRVAFERLWGQWAGTPAPSSGREAVQFRASVLDTMIDNLLVLQEARKVGIVASPQEITDKTNALKIQVNLTDAQMNEDLARAGLTRQTLDGIMREDVIVEKFLRLMVVKDVAQDGQQDAVRNWYNNALAKATIDKHIESGGAKVGQPAPDFTLNDLDGKPVRLSDLKGKAIFINFWATWCNPCRAEMPDIEAVWKAYKDRGLVVLAVNLTDQDNPEDVKAYIKEFNLTFPALLDARGSVSSLYRVGPIPSSYFVDRLGNLTAVQVGAMSRQTMDNRLAKIIQ